MPRHRKRRRCYWQPTVQEFQPVGGLPSQTGSIDTEAIDLEIDELEAMRLVDLLNKEQAQAGEEMGVSRGTVQRLLYSGRSKVARALLEGKPLRIKGSEHVVAMWKLSCNHGHEWNVPYDQAEDIETICPQCGDSNIYKIDYRGQRCGFGRRGRRWQWPASGPTSI